MAVEIRQLRREKPTECRQSGYDINAGTRGFHQNGPENQGTRWQSRRHPNCPRTLTNGGGKDWA